MIFSLLSLSVAVVYLILCIWLSRGLSKVSRKGADSSQNITVSVIIAARNEEKSIGKTLETLKAQSYPADLFTITVVDDRSEDNTAAIVKQYQQDMPHLHLCHVTHVTEGVAPKKNAINLGVETSSNEIILITDADCILPPKWIETVVSFFSDPKVGLVQGLTGYPKSSSSFFSRFQQLDFFSHSVVAAAGIGRNVPINSNANNFAYRRSIFDSLDGYGDVAHVISGDDDLLLQRVWEQGEWDIRYMATPEAAVVTEAAETLPEMLNQRKRWGSKTVYYKPKQVVILASIFLFYIIVAVNTLLLPFSLSAPLPALSLYGVKIAGELFFLIPGTAIFNRKDLRRSIFWSSPLQLYLVLYSVLAGVFGSFSWKGESYKRAVNNKVKH